MQAIRPYILAIILVVAVAYPIVEVFFTKFPQFTVMDYWAEKPIAGHLMPMGDFYTCWLVTAALCIVFRCGVIIHSYFSSVRQFGKELFGRQFALYFISFIVGFGFGLGLLAVIGGVAMAMGYSFGDGFELFNHVATGVQSFIYRYVPTLFPVNSYWFALLLTFVFASLPNYILHRLSHTSRLMWYVFHRPHHTPEILHPLAAPPAFMFEFAFVVPNVLIIAVISKLFSYQPLLMEAYFIFVAGYFMEIFNHSPSHYGFAYRNPIIRNLCRLTGDTGVYHLMHHSAVQTDQMINLSGGPFNLWDRLFGTYKKPYPQMPPTGLTGVPAIRYNPFAVILSGMQQIGYEWRANKNWWTRFKIIFGSVYYKPPITKEYLILSQHEVH